MYRRGNGEARCRRARRAAGQAVLLSWALFSLVPGTLPAQWVSPPGEGWADVSIYHLDTREAFGFDGRVGEFFAEGHAVSTSAFLTVAGGLLPGVDGWIQLPYHRLRYDDARADRLRSGIGDTKLFLRIAPLHFLGSELPLAIRGGAKFGVGDFAVDSEVIPLGDGQTDWEVIGEIGHSFWPAELYVTGWAGYRWREPNEAAERDYGDEAFYLVQIGGSLGRIGAQLIIEGMSSVTTPVIEGIPLRNARRSLHQVMPRLSYAAGPGAWSLGLRVPVRGRNLPGGTSLVLGYFTRWSLTRERRRPADNSGADRKSPRPRADAAAAGSRQ